LPVGSQSIQLFLGVFVFRNFTQNIFRVNVSLFGLGKCRQW
jgi:hypothetical protein